MVSFYQNEQLINTYIKTVVSGKHIKVNLCLQDKLKGLNSFFFFFKLTHPSRSKGYKYSLKKLRYDDHTEVFHGKDE